MRTNQTSMKRQRTWFKRIWLCAVSLLLNRPLCRGFSTSRTTRLRVQFSTHQSSTRLSTRILTTSALHLGNQTDLQEDWLTVSDRGLLIADLLASIVACQLLGLQDALDSPTFWENGGLLQPPTVPSSLPVLVSRISVNSFCWIAASLSLSGYKGMRSSSDTIASGLQVTAGFVGLRLLIAVLIALLQASDMDTVQLLRECYFVALAAVGARYTYHQLFYR